VLGLILGEALVISVAGGALGYGISVLLMQGVAKSPFGSFLPPMPIIEPSVAGICLAAAGVIGLISSIAPAMGSSRTPIVQALRSSD
jgi:ABC-type antimicrobial peptide transport system permease subunit